MRLRLRDRVEGRFDVELPRDRRRHLAGQALADPARLDERWRKPDVRYLWRAVKGGWSKLMGISPPVADDSPNPAIVVGTDSTRMS